MPVASCGFRCDIQPLADCGFWLRVIVENFVGYRSWGLLVEMRHWVECQVASAVVEWMIERQGSFEWINQGGDVFC